MNRVTKLFAAACLFASGTGALAQEVIATLDGEASGVRIEITELSRTSGDTLTMKFRLLNDTGEDFGFYSLMGSYEVSALHLIDAAGKKKYLVITDSDGKCLCSTALDKVENGKALNLWARFPAPPIEVTEVSVVMPHFIPTDAPISQ